MGFGSRRTAITSLLILWVTILAGCFPLRNPTAQLTPTSAPGVSPSPTGASSPTAELFSDPFIYCANIGTIDIPDQRYSGPKITDDLVKGYLTAAGIAANSDYSDIYKQMTIWRCMDKKVYACNFGANLPCDSKADTNSIPTQAMNDFCKENKDSDFIPMSVTGHTTIYNWRCVNDTAQVLDQIDQPDPAGYLSRIWYKIEPAR